MRDPLVPQRGNVMGFRFVVSPSRCLLVGRWWWSLEARDTVPASPGAPGSGWVQRCPVTGCGGYPTNGLGVAILGPCSESAFFLEIIPEASQRRDLQSSFCLRRGYWSKQLTTSFRSMHTRDGETSLALTPSRVLPVPWLWEQRMLSVGAALTAAAKPHSPFRSVPAPTPRRQRVFPGAVWRAVLSKLSMGLVWIKTLDLETVWCLDVF